MSDTKYIWGKNGKQASVNGNGLKGNGVHVNGAVKNGTARVTTRPGQQPAVQAEYCWWDGDLVPFDQATVHFLNPTMHYGAGVFEGIRCYETLRGPAVFRLHDHLERFINSARILGLSDMGYSVDELVRAVQCTITANHFQSCYIRPMLYFNGSMGLNLDAYQPVVAIAAWEWGTFLGQEALENGVRMMVSSFTRMHPNASMTKAKISGQYVNSIMAKTMAQRAGFDEAIMLDHEGYVAECTGENLFMVRDGVIYTPPRTTILEGITRDTVMVLAADAGYDVVEEPISRDQLYIADEVFVCGTAAEVVAVREIDYRRIGEGRMGKVARRLQRDFFDLVKGQARRSAEWLDYMVWEPLY